MNGGIVPGENLDRWWTVASQGSDHWWDGFRAHPGREKHKTPQIFWDKKLTFVKDVAIFLLGRTFLHLEWCLSHHLWGFMINASVVSWIYEWVISTGAGGIEADTWRISWEATFTNNGNLPRKFGFQAGQDKGGIVDVHWAVSKRRNYYKDFQDGLFLGWNFLQFHFDLHWIPYKAENN